MKVISATVVAALAVVGLQGSAEAAMDMDCANFGSQKAAQIFFLNNSPAADPHNLDADGDWVVCESNPAPYYYGRNPNPDAPQAPVPVAQIPQPPKPQPKPQPLKVVKVLDGELVRVRQAPQPAFVVHLLGTKIPDQSCERKAATKDLRSWVKPGMVVKSVQDNSAPNKDRDGNLWRELTRVKGNFDIGGSQVEAGFAMVQGGLRFKARDRYLRWEQDAAT